MKFTRKQEQKLIELGLKTLINESFQPLSRKPTRTRRHTKLKTEPITRQRRQRRSWSKEQRDKFMRTWNAKHKLETE